MSINYGAHEQWYRSAISWLASAEDWLSKQWPRRTAELNLVLQHHSLDLAACETHAVTGRVFCLVCKELGYICFLPYIFHPCSNIVWACFQLASEMAPCMKTSHQQDFPLFIFLFPTVHTTPLWPALLIPLSLCSCQQFSLSYASSPTTWN